MLTLTFIQVSVTSLPFRHTHAHRHETHTASDTRAHTQFSVETQTHMTFTRLSASPLPLRVATGCGVGLLVHTHAHLAHRYTPPSCFVLVHTLPHTQCSHKPSSEHHSHTRTGNTETLSCVHTHGADLGGTAPCTHEALPGVHPHRASHIKLSPAAPRLPPAHPHSLCPLPLWLGALRAGPCRHMGSRTGTCAHHVNAHKTVALTTAT